MARFHGAYALDFRQVYEQHAGVVRGALQQLGVEPALLDDATQDVFVVLFRRIEDYDATRSLRSWLWGIARGVASGYRRSHRRARRLRANLPAPQAGPHAEELVARRQALRVLADFLTTLDHDKCAVFVMAELEGQTGPEIAARLDVNINTVYARLRAARQRFDCAIRRRRERAPQVLAFAPLWKWPASVPQTAASVALAAPLVLANVAAEQRDLIGRDTTIVIPSAVPLSRKPAGSDKDALESTTLDQGAHAMPIPTMTLSALLVTAPAPAAAGPAPVDDQDADEAACEDSGAGFTRCTFENDRLTGDVLGPNGELIPFRRPTKHGSLLDIRAHFIPELIRLGNDV